MNWNSLCIQLLCTVGLVSATAVAQQPNFPYPATIAVDDVEVRCGPGQRFYVTSKLQQGARVLVHRHDHGGWFMIAPPPGSFSWIDAELVELQGNVGVVRVPTAPNGQPGRAIVRIGSALSDDHAYSGRQLSPGEQVTVIGRQTLRTEQGYREMLKIEPPPQEFRWIKGDFVVPLDNLVHQQQEHDPYQIPPQHRTRLPRDLIIAADSTPPRNSPAQGNITPQLSLLDQRLAEMLNKDPREWQLDQLATEYRGLQAQGTDREKSQIQERLKLIEERRAIWDRYQQFAQLTAATTRRDAQLASGQPGAAMQVIPGAYTVPAGTAYAMNVTSESTLPISRPADPEPDVQPRLNGAGIIQPINRAGYPPFAITAPDGRLLAYLIPADPQQLQGWVGREAGIIGQRSFEPRLNADVIQIRRLQPVKLVR